MQSFREFWDELNKDFAVLAFILLIVSSVFIIRAKNDPVIASYVDFIKNILKIMIVLGPTGIVACLYKVIMSEVPIKRDYIVSSFAYGGFCTAYALIMFILL